MTHVSFSSYSTAKRVVPIIVQFLWADSQDCWKHNLDLERTTQSRIRYMDHVLSKEECSPTSGYPVAVAEKVYKYFALLAGKVFTKLNLSSYRQ
jgi:hypothetical protein